jgi:hypothetical protein
MALGLRIVAQVTRHDAGDGFPLGLTNPPHMAAQPPLRGTRRFLENFFVTPALSVPSWNGARGAGPSRRSDPAREAKRIEISGELSFPGDVF